MKIYKNSSKEIRFIVLVFIFISILLIVSKIVSLNQLSAMNDMTGMIYKHPLKVSNAALQVRSELFKMHRDMKDIVMAQSDKELEERIIDVENDEQIINQNLLIIRKNILGEKGQKLESETEALFKAGEPIRDEIIKLVKSHRKDDAIEMAKGKGANYVTSLEASTLKLYQYALNNANYYNDLADTTYI